MLFGNRRQTILVIDDDASLRRQLNFRLRRKDKRDLVEADSGKAGLELAARINPDLIILDGVLPDIQGIEVLKRLRQANDTADIPVLMLTGQNKIGNIDDAFNLGANAYLIKPFCRYKLSEKVAQLLGENGE